MALYVLRESIEDSRAYLLNLRLESGRRSTDERGLRGEDRLPGSGLLGEVLK